MSPPHASTVDPFTVTRSVSVAVSAAEDPVLSIIIPVHNEEAVLPTLLAELARTFAAIPCELVFVDDGSTDQSVDIILSADLPNVRLISLSRNFGHQPAVKAGIDHSSGQYALIMDADLQDPPEVALRMFERAREGFDIVYAVRKKRRESPLKRACYWLFYRFLRLITPINIPIDSGDFCVLSHRMLIELKNVREHHVFIRGLRAYFGFSSTAVEYDRPARAAGESKYTWRRLLELAYDGIFSLSHFPLRLATYIGYLFTFLALVSAVGLVLLKLFATVAVQGWTSMIVVMLLCFGINFLIVGIQGEYIARILDDTRQRPLYVVARDTKRNDFQFR